MMDESFPSSTLDAGFGQTDTGVSVQPVHSSGVTRVVHAPAPAQKSKEIFRLFTAGDDYLVRILPAQIDPNFEPMIIDDATKSITWIDADADYLVTAAEDGCVRIYQHSIPTSMNNDPSSSSPTDLVCILTRSALPTRCVALERQVGREKTPRVAVCTDDLVIKVIDVADPKRVQLLTGHERSPRAASWSPLEALLVTSSCDGAVKVWDLSSPEPQCVKTLTGMLTPAAADSELNAQACWHPSGETFVLPSKTHEIAIVTRERSDWRTSGSLVATGNESIRTATGEISAMAFSPNGRYLAVSTTDGQITVWDWSSRKPLRCKRSTSLITMISWHPGLDALAWSDNSGQLSRWRNVVGSTLPSPCEHVAYLSRDAQKRKAQTDEIDDLFDGTGADDIEDEAQYDQLRSQTGRPDERSARDADTVTRLRYRDSVSLADPTKSQALFQPTSTPMRNSRRYLSFNTVGSLIAIDQATHQSISFESFDASARRNWRFVDHFGYNIASIGAHGALMACQEEAGDEYDEDDDEEEGGPRVNKGHASNILFKPFEIPGGWTMPGAEWSVNLPRGETALAVAMAGRRSAQHVALDNCTAVVATSAGYLRFFTGSGLQRYIWAFGSQIVTIAAGNRFLLVIHRNGPAYDGHQNLLYTLIDVSTLEKRQEGLLPIRNGGTITWAGFSEMDVPAVFDNQGLLLLLDRATSSAGQSRWIPALDTKALAVKEGRSEDGPVSRIKYWPVGLDGQNLLAVMLKGQNVPDASSTSRPIIQDLALTMPVAGAGDATGMLEEQLLRQTHLATFARAFRSSLQPEEEEEEFYADLLDQPAARAGTLEHEADKAVLQIIQQSCKSNKHQRVLDAARELHSARTLDAAMQIGTFFHLSTLVDRMNALRGWVSERAERDERMVIGTQPVMYAAATAPADSRILVESSPGPSGAAVDSKQAKRALGRDFESLPSTRHQRGARSELAKVGQSPSSTWAGHNAQSSNVEEEENVSQAEDSDAYMAEPNGSPVGAGQKRRSNEIGEEEMLGQSAHNSGATKRARESTVTSPFSNKTNKTFPKPPMASTTTASKNPFARTATAGMTRDKSLHKSNSFFDRVDTANARSAPSGAQKTKQATLFGMTTGVRSSTAAVSPVVVATSVFGDNETQQTMPTNEEPYTEQAMDLSLRAARRRDEESQVQMEETQYAGDEGEEESQDASHNAQAATSIGVS